MRELSLHILDALRNALEAGASTVELIVDEDRAADRLTITVRDDGRGMSADQMARVFDPFYTTRTTRHVGMGLPLFKAAAERCAGEFSIASRPGEGTTLRATFQHSHIDRAPLGDLTGTLLAVILSGGCDLHYVHRLDGREFSFRTEDVRAELGGVPLTHPRVRRWLQDYLSASEDALRKG